MHDNDVSEAEPVESAETESTEPNEPPIIRTVKVWADTVSKGHVAPCRGRTCKVRLWFARTVARDKPMPFDGPIGCVRVETETSTGRKIWCVDERRVHFANCPDAKRFSKRAKK